MRSQNFVWESNDQCHTHLVITQIRILEEIDPSRIYGGIFYVQLIYHDPDSGKRNVKIDKLDKYL